MALTSQNYLIVPDIPLEHLVLVPVDTGAAGF